MSECGCVYISLVIHCSVAVEDAHYSDKGSVCVYMCVCVYVCVYLLGYTLKCGFRLCYANSLTRSLAHSLSTNVLIYFQRRSRSRTVTMY